MMMTHQLVTRTAEITNSYLRDFDWKLKVSLAGRVFTQTTFYMYNNNVFGNLS